MEIGIGIAVLLLAFITIILFKIIGIKDNTEQKFNNKMNKKTSAKKNNFVVSKLSQQHVDSQLQTYDVILIQSGNNKIQVIKEIRAITGFDLVSAKQIVDTYNSNFTVNATKDKIEDFLNVLQSLGAEVILKNNSNTLNENRSSQTSAEMKVFEFILIDSGPNKINAIKEIRDFTGLGLKESKDIIDKKDSIITARTSNSKAVAFLNLMKSIGADIRQI